MSGKTKTKQDALINALYLLSCAMRPYAKKSGKPEIFELVDFEEYELGKMRDTTLLEYAKKVLKKANEVSSDLVKYNVTAGELADVQRNIDAYEKALGTRHKPAANDAGNPPQI